MYGASLRDVTDWPRSLFMQLVEWVLLCLQQMQYNHGLPCTVFDFAKQFSVRSDACGQINFYFTMVVPLAHGLGAFPGKSCIRAVSGLQACHSNVSRTESVHTRRVTNVVV
jgi:hypothetical protein